MCKKIILIIWIEYSYIIFSIMHIYSIQEIQIFIIIIIQIYKMLGIHYKNSKLDLF